MTSLGDVIEEEMPIDRVVASCGECGFELYDSIEKTKQTPYLTGSLIENLAIKHRQETSHDDLEVSIDKPAKIKRDIDCTITVNE